MAKELDFQAGYSGLTPADIASFLKVTFTTSEQNLVTTLITEVERTLCNYTNRQFLTGVDYEKTFESGRDEFELHNIPISKVSKIEIDGVDVTANYTLGSDYWIIDELSVRFKTPLVSQDLYTGVKFYYQIRQFWGDDVKLLLKKWIAYEFLNSEYAGVGINSDSFAELSRNFDVAGFNREKQRLIDYYAIRGV